MRISLIVRATQIGALRRRHQSCRPRRLANRSSAFPECDARVPIGFGILPTSTGISRVSDQLFAVAIRRGRLLSAARIGRHPSLASDHYSGIDDRPENATVGRLRKTDRDDQNIFSSRTISFRLSHQFFQSHLVCHSSLAGGASFARHGLMRRRGRGKPLVGRVIGRLFAAIGTQRFMNTESNKVQVRRTTGKRTHRRFGAKSTEGKAPLQYINILFRSDSNRRMRSWGCRSTWVEEPVITCRATDTRGRRAFYLCAVLSATI